MYNVGPQSELRKFGIRSCRILFAPGVLCARREEYMVPVTIYSGNHIYGYHVVMTLLRLKNLLLPCNNNMGT